MTHNKITHFLTVVCKANEIALKNKILPLSEDAKWY